MEYGKHGIINATPTGGAVFGFIGTTNSLELIEMLSVNGFIDGQDIKDFAYGQLIEGLDDNAIAYVLAKMVQAHSPAILDEFSVVKGAYMNEIHSWIRINDAEHIIIDPTLSQFEEDANDICIVDTTYNNKYVRDMSVITNARAWLNRFSDKEATDVGQNPEIIAVDALDDKESHEYVIGGGLYSYDHRLSGIELFTLILEEQELELDSLRAEDLMLDETELEDLRTSYSGAILKFQTLSDTESYLRDRAENDA